MDIHRLISTFLNRLAGHVENASQLSESEQDEIHKLFLKLRAAGTLQAQSPGHKPATRYWKKALESISIGPAADLGQVLESLTPYFCWMGNPNYTPENTRQPFLDNYAFAEMIGPDGLCYSDTASMGVMLLGPDTYYPPHTHPTIECLYVLTGRVTWHLADGPTSSLPPGTAVFMPEGRPHAFWSMQAPTVGVYLCSGKVATYPVLTENMRHPDSLGG